MKTKGCKPSLAGRLAFPVLLLACTVARADPTFKLLHAFGASQDGAGVWGSVALDAMGNIYGTTSAGGSHKGGIAFRLSPRPDGSWREAILHDFYSWKHDGATPFAGVMVDPLGNVYGTTQLGGAHFYGTVFELSPGARGWKETVLYSSPTSPGPVSGVVMDSSGNLYGTAGVAYELTRGASGWKEVVLHNFTGKHGDGVGPAAGVIFDDAGNLYGTTGWGGTGCGSEGCGTVYELAPEAGGKWKETILHRFDNNGTDGVEPGFGALAMDAAGSLYGTTRGGGLNFCGGVGSRPAGTAPGRPAASSGRTPGPQIGNCGIIFRLTKDAKGHWKETILYNFATGAPGFGPNSGVVIDTAGNLYGMTMYGGDLGCDCGVVYELSPVPKGQWTYTVLHRFVGSDGAQPDANLILDDEGNLYGTAVTGGQYGGGVAFELTP